MTAGQLPARLAATSAEVGPMISGGDVELAVQRTLAAWLPAYLCEYERQHGLDVGRTPWPKGWARVGRNLQKLNTDQLPTVVLMAGGILNPPQAYGSTRAWRATWTLDVGVVISNAWGSNPGGARDHAHTYAAAIRTLLGQRPLDGLAAAVDFRGEAYDGDDFSTSRTFAVAAVSFAVEVEAIGWANGGPPVTPDVDPPVDPTDPLDPWVRVRETEETVVKQPITQED